MKRSLAALALAGSAVAVAACGSGSGYGSSSGTTAAPSANPGAVSVATVGGMAKVLVDAAGKPLYSPDEEAHGMVLCTGSCTSIWVPVAAATNQAAAGPDGLTLGTIARPDGSHQLTADGKPLYTFAEDSAGQLKGNGLTDQFGTQHFTWHVVEAGNAPTQAPAATTPNKNSSYSY
jgi:predicted lipoprotein with Yx(FWY)xxD motif